MKACVLLGVFLAFISVCEADVGDTCTSKSECAADECCQIINIVVMSRKRQAFLPNNQQGTGTCQKYKQEGASCVSYEVMNGFCGCAPGLTCRSVYIGTPSPPTAPIRRDFRPGYASYCTATTP